MCFRLTLWNDPTIDRLNRDQTPSMLLVYTSPTPHCSAERKRLARRSAGNDHYIGYPSIVEIANIALVQRPLVHRVKVKALILAKGLTGVMISPDHRRMPETRSCSASVGRRFHTPRSSTQPTRRDGETERSPCREACSRQVLEARIPAAIWAGGRARSRRAGARNTHERK